jgi:hypothetical protein
VKPSRFMKAAIAASDSGPPDGDGKIKRSG